MEAILLKLIANKEFGALVIICIFTVAHYFQNKGQFALHLEKIDRIKERSDEAKTDSSDAKEKSLYAVKISKKAIKATTATQKLARNTHSEVKKISKNIEELSLSCKNLIDGKYGEKESKTN